MPLNLLDPPTLIILKALRVAKAKKKSRIFKKLLKLKLNRLLTLRTQNEFDKFLLKLSNLRKSKSIMI